MSSAPAPTPFDLSTLHVYIRSRLAALLSPDCQDCQEHESHIATLKKKLPHIFASHNLYQIQPSTAPINSLIDHTILKPESRLSDVEQLCGEAIKHQFATVCVNGSRVRDCVNYFNHHCPSGTYRPRITAVVGFPLGAMESSAKAFETILVTRAGADEVDMVLNIGQLKDGNFKAVLSDIQTVQAAINQANHELLPNQPRKKLKVIFETCLLTDLEIIDATILSVLAGVDFVKTSTGFSTGGAQPAQVRLMKLIVGSSAEVKASGGIRDAATAKKMIENGATRLGCSASVAICTAEQPTATATATSAASTHEADKY